MRVACYIDGFNLYHAIDDLRKPHLKWLNLHSLAASLCRDGETLVKVAYFSAFATWKGQDVYARHRQYVAALKSASVECHMARFSEKSASCRSCGASWKQHEEKETDVHFSLTFLEDAMDNVFDRAIIVSADSDHVPAVRRVRARFPAKQIFVASPPERHGHARGLIQACNSATMITQGRIAKHLFPAEIIGLDGTVLATRPQRYDPPV